MAEVRPLPHDDPKAVLAAFTTEGMAEAIDNDIDAGLRSSGSEDMTAALRDEPRLQRGERCDYLLPTVAHCESAEEPLAKKEYMFPMVSVVRSPQERMISEIGTTLVGTALTEDPAFRGALLDAPHIDRLNLGPIPTIQLNWLQPHEGNIVDFLFRARAYQEAPVAVGAAG